MGYTTSFYGSFKLDRPLTENHLAYLNAFAFTRRIARDAAKAALLPDPIRLAAGLPIGEDGAYFVGSIDNSGQDNDASVLNYNSSPGQQPGLWCQWTPSKDGSEIEWDGDEKFYHYEEWLTYIIGHFLMPWGYVLNGDVEWVGEDENDRGRISVVRNAVDVRYGRIVYDDDEDPEQIKSERDAFREELSAVMPVDYNDWWESSEDGWPLVAAQTIINLREREATADKVLRAVDVTMDANRKNLLNMWVGAARSGRWLFGGAECSRDTEGAEWHSYTDAEQAAWLRDGVVPLLERMLFQGSPPVIPKDVIEDHGFDEEPDYDTIYPRTNEG